MIILGLTGSVATVLGNKLIKALLEIDDVEVILTEKAEAFTGQINLPFSKVYREKDEWTWDMGKTYERNYYKKDDKVLHIDLRNRGSALVIAPTSANTLGKIACGLCDNLLTSVVRAWDRNRPIILAPAMNTHMWESPHTNNHLDLISKFENYSIVPPQSKMLACGQVGMGAMANIDEIVDHVKARLDEWYFPLHNCAGIPVNPHPGAFKYKRKDYVHTGVDLYTTDNAPVYAVEDGTIVGIEHFTGEWDNSPWWNNTDCVLVEGKTGVICYGEVSFSDSLKIGNKIKRGEETGMFVKRVIKEGKERPDIPGHSTSMLHLELYPHGTTKASEGFSEILRDPTPYLLKSMNKPENFLIYDGYRP